jgi:hypothetical protein
MPTRVLHCRQYTFGGTERNLLLAEGLAWLPNVRSGVIRADLALACRGPIRGIAIRQVPRAAAWKTPRLFARFGVSNGAAHDRSPPHAVGARAETASPRRSSLSGAGRDRDHAAVNTGRRPRWSSKHRLLTLDGSVHRRIAAHRETTARQTGSGQDPVVYNGAPIARQSDAGARVGARCKSYGRPHAQRGSTPVARGRAFPTRVLHCWRRPGAPAAGGLRAPSRRG